MKVYFIIGILFMLGSISGWCKNLDKHFQILPMPQNIEIEEGKTITKLVEVKKRNSRKLHML